MEQREAPTKPPKVSIEFKDFSLTVSNEALCTTDQIKSAFAKVKEKYPEIVEGLPEGHPWRDDKITHATAVKRKGGRVFEEFKRQLSKENFALLIFIAGVHDIGRAIQAKKDHDIPVEEEFAESTNHGKYSVIALKKWGIFDILPEKASEIVAFAVEHHGDKLTPPLPRFPYEDEKLKFFFCAILRDMDKLEGIIGETNNYLFNEEYKGEQIKVNKLQGEEDKIVPRQVLDLFENYQPIDNDLCKSYESYILKLLAWIYDINLRGALNEILESRVIQDYFFKYFRKQLPPEESERIVKATKDYLASRGLKLEE